MYTQNINKTDEVSKNLKRKILENYKKFKFKCLKILDKNIK